MKYIKWICLTIAIIGFIILGTIFINKNNIPTPQPEEKEFEMTDIYNTAWYKKGVAYYENGEISSENLKLEDFRYIIFYETHVEYHNPITEHTDTYNYTYDNENKTITINSEDYLLAKGTYSITFENNYLKLSKSIDGNDYIYYFESSKG